MYTIADNAPKQVREKLERFMRGEQPKETYEYDVNRDLRESRKHLDLVQTAIHNKPEDPNSGWYI